MFGRGVCGGGEECGGRAASVSSRFFACFCSVLFVFLLSSSIKGEETAYQLGKPVK